MTAGRPGLTPLELASGRILERSPSSPGRGPDEVPGRAAVRLIEDLLRPALRAEALFAFSGGRVSSALLALAHRLSRDESLAPPTPLTGTFGASEEEERWQRAVIEHLGLDEWQRVALGPHLDALGDPALAEVAGRGVRLPLGPAVLTDALRRHAAGRPVVTGFDAGLFGAYRWWRFAPLLHGRERPHPSDLGLLVAALPRTARTALALAGPRHRSARLPWLTQDANAEMVRDVQRRWAAEPVRWDHWVRWLIDRDATAAARMAALGPDVLAPLMDQRVMEALALEGGRAGLGNRGDMVRHLAVELLPAELLDRPPDASYVSALWGPAAVALAGIRVAPTPQIAELVNAPRLRAEWRRPAFGTLSLAALQASALS